MKSNIKHVLLIVSEFPPSPGGIGNHAFSIAQALRSKYLEVTVLTDEQGAEINLIDSFDKQQSFRIIRVQRNFLFFYFSRIRRAFDLMKDCQPDAVIVSGKFSLWIGALLKLRFSISVTAILHGSEVQLPGIIPRWLTYRSIKLMDKIISVSQFTQQLLSASLHISKPNIVIPNGVDLLEFKPTISKTDKKLKGNPSLLTIGNVTKRKGHHRVIQVLPLLTTVFPEIHYHSIGIPTMKAHLEELAASFQISDRVTFHGKVIDRMEMFEKAKTATIFIMLSENQDDGEIEGFGIAILEANALGIPAIGAKGSGIEDAICQHFNGVLVDGNSALEVLEAIQIIQRDYQKFSCNSIAWAKQHSWDTLIEKYISFIFEKK